MSEARIVRCPNCNHHTAVPVVEPTKSKWDRWGKFAAILGSLASIGVGLVVGLSPTETTDIGKARAFLGSYFGNAPHEPEKTWQNLAESYKQNNSDDLTYEGYVKYFSQFKTMTVDEVANYEGQSGGEWYSADLFRLNKNGTSATTRLAYQLQCPWQTKLPLIGCSPDNIQIANVCEVQPSGLCREDEALTGSSDES